MSEPCYTTRATCRVCGSASLTPLFSLGKQYVSDFVTKDKIHSGYQCPIELVLCAGCTLVQARHTAPQDFLYTRHYHYRSSVTQTMRDALRDVTAAAERMVDLKPGDVVLDIGCLPDGFVYTSGFIPRDIREIKVGEEVLGKSGFVRVARTFSRDYCGELVTLRLLGDPRRLRLTPNHPVLVVRPPIGNKAATKVAAYFAAVEPTWVPAEELRSGDYCAVPSVAAGETELHIDLSEYVACETDADLAYATQTHGFTLEHQRAHNQKPIPRRYLLFEEFGRLLGYYIAEGSGDGVNSGAFVFAFHRDEVEYVRDVRGLLASVFGLESSVSPGNGKAVCINVSSALGKRFLQSLVGTGAANKHLPAFAFSAPHEFVCGLLTGMFRGDGSFCSGYAKYDTVSESLAYQLKYLLLLLGVNSSVVPNKPNGFGKENGKILLSVRIFGVTDLARLSEIVGEDVPCRSDNSQVSWPRCGGLTLVRIITATREAYSGKVFNLETTDHTYVASSAVVHNSNDGTLLRSYSVPGLFTVGFEPATNLAEEGKRGVKAFIGEFWDNRLFRKLFDCQAAQVVWKNSVGTKAKVITAIGMFYDLEDPNAFIADVAKALHPEGVFIAQLMCARQMLAANDVGNLAHEHLEFYTLKSLGLLLGNHGLEMFGIESNEVNGGSYRLYVQHKGGPRSRGGSVWKHRLVEENDGVSDISAYDRFFGRAQANRYNCGRFIQKEVNRGKRVWVLGASTKGNVLLQWYSLDHTLIEAAADRDPRKHGLYTVSTGIPIVSEEAFREAQPDFAIILPYAFKAEIMEREKEWHAGGGRFLIPLPAFEVM